MAIKTAGTARSQHRANRKRRRLLITGAMILLIAVVAIVAHSMIASKKAAKVALDTKTGQTISLEARQTADINLVAGAVGQYSAANNMLPARLSATPSGGLVLCGNACDASADTVSGLVMYQAANIHLMSYSPGLAAPNQEAMYLVPGARCASDGHLGAPNQTPDSMVILYETVGTTAAATRCIVL